MTPIERMFDPETFRENGHALIALLADHLAASYEKKTGEKNYR